MKRITLLMAFMSTLWGFAQVKNYVFTQSSGTYHEITDGTILLGSTTPDWTYLDPATPGGSNTNLGGPGDGFNIGFNFTYDGTVYDKFAVSSNGMIQLGSSSWDVPIAFTYVSSNAALSYVGTSQNPRYTSLIAPLAGNMSSRAGSNAIQYKTTGTAPNRTLIVQWKEFRRAASPQGDGDSFNFQVMLNETTNTVQFVYGGFLCNSSLVYDTFQVGLRGAPASAATDYVNRTSATSWSQTDAGTVPGATVTLSTASMPASGLTFTWTPLACGGPNAYVLNAVSSSGATFSWGSYIPAPAGYEYVVSKATTLPVGSGTPVSSPTATVTALDPNSVYNVFVRSACSGLFSPWSSIGTFKTRCLDVTTFVENFDTTSTNPQTVPDCWATTGTTSSVYVVGKGVAPGTVPNALMMLANPTSAQNLAYAVLPSVSNLHANTNQLRFKAYCDLSLNNSNTGTLDVGYFTDVNNASTFTKIASTPALSTDSSNPTVVVIVPGVLPVGIENLVIKNSGNTSLSAIMYVYIDDVSWELIPQCADVTALVTKGYTDTSVNVRWTPSTSGDTSWDYIVAPAATSSPFGLTAVPATSVTGTSTKSMTVSGLQSATAYKVWVRSHCAAGLSSWIGPATFNTTCPLATEFAEGFDVSTSLPSCWVKVGTGGTGTASVATPTTPALSSTPNVLSLNAVAVGDYAIVSMPPVSNDNTDTANVPHQLRFKAYSSAAGGVIQVGYLTDSSDASTFQLLQSINPSTTGLIAVGPLNFGDTPTTPYLAFKNAGAVKGSIYIDDVVWEPIPVCPSISNLKVVSVVGTTAKISWTASANGETTWQYAYGPSTVSNPYTLGGNVISGNPILTLSTLNASSDYKVWVRPQCYDGSYGSWMDPVEFKTACAIVTDFTENFDEFPAHVIPPCWVTVSTYAGNVVDGTKPSNPEQGNFLTISATYVNAPTYQNTVVSLPPVSNAGDGTHRLNFNFLSDTAGASIDVGYVTSLTDASTFVQLQTIAITTPGVLQNVLAELGKAPTSQYLAFRNPGVIACSIYIDDVKWEPIPMCPNVSNVKKTEIAPTSISVSWTAGGSETTWQYASGPATSTNPNLLDPVDVTVTNATIASLTPNTSYSVWVRSKCTNGVFGYWSDPVTVTTPCDAVTSFFQDFDESISFPSCWNRVGNGDALPASSDGSFSGTNSIHMGATTVVAMPPVSNIPAGTNILKFKFKGSAYGAPLVVGYVTDSSDPASFVPYQTVYASSSTVFDVVIMDMKTSPVSQIMAFQNPAAAGTTIIDIDDVSWDLKPTALPACASGLTATTDPNCGNASTVISWSQAAGADGYKITIGTTPQAKDVLNNEDAEAALSYSFRGTTSTTYYYTITPYNFLGDKTGCTQQSYTTIAQGCYCASVPTHPDGNGITTAVLDGAVFTNPAVTYSDFTAKPISIAQGATSNLQLTFDIGNKVYNTKVFIDLNDDFNFDQDEALFSGVTPSTYPTLLDASLPLPADAKLGTHRLRVSAWYGNAPVDPCYNGNEGVTLDFTVNVIAAVANDVPSGAIGLTVGGLFADHAITGTNVNSTGSTAEPAPGCGGYQGDDVWYYALVPASGIVTFEVNSVPGGLTDTAGAIYSGASGSLVLVACDDNSSLASANQPLVNATGRTPGEKLYFRVWDNGGGNFGAFQVSAYYNPLAVSVFDTNNFSYYPNPVNDILNLSFDQNIDTVTVFNLLGQQIIAKKLNAAQGNIDFSGLSSGAYMVKVTSGDQSKTIKVLKD